MDTIIQFLRDEDKPANNAEQIDVSAKDVESINNLFAGRDIARPGHLRMRPKVGKNQIWSVKSEYIDFLGNRQSISHPLIVSIVTDIDEIEDEEFVRVYVVSPFVEMATEHDEVCRDASIIGFPFLIEIWNEQPVLTEILDSYLGYYEVVNSSIKQEKPNPVQGMFREVEISRAKYLNHSIMVLLACFENVQAHEFTANISFFGHTQHLHYQKEKPSSNVFILQEPQVEYSTAAKSGITKQDKYIEYNEQSLPFNIQIRKNDEGFILTVTPVCDVEFLL